MENKTRVRDLVNDAQLKAATSGMSQEAMDEFHKRVVSAKSLGIKTKGYDSHKGREIAILAMGPSRGQCPFTCETWGLNTGWKQALVMGGKLEKVFIAHEQVYSEEGNPYFEWDKMKRQSFELVMIHDLKEVRESGIQWTLFPLERIKAKFDTDYFSDTICYMIAYAVDLVTIGGYGTKLELMYPLKLSLYGVDMQDYSEYQLEKGGIEYWLGRAQSLGVEFKISFGGTLLLTDTGKEYGLKSFEYENVLPDGVKKEDLINNGRFMRDDELQQQIRAAVSGGQPATDR